MLLVCLAFAGSLVAKEANNVKPWEAEKIAPAKSNNSAVKMELPAQFRTRSVVYARANEYTDGFFVSFDTDTPGDMTEIIAPPTWASYAGDFGQLDETMIYVQNSDTYELMSVDVATGNATVIGATGLDTNLNDMAMNKQTGVMYAVTSTELYTIDLTTGVATLVGALNNNGGIMITLACDGVNLYGIDMSTDDFWSIDPTTGAATMIGAVGFDLSYAQSMSWDPATDTIFWASYGGGLDGKLRTIDPATGAATIVADFEGGREVTVLAFPGGGADPNAPAEPTNFTVTPDATGALSVEIAWTNPDTNVEGGTLTELNDVKVYRDDTLIHTVSSPTMGNAETYTDSDVPANGLYAYKVVGSNTNGDGLPIAETVFVGNDVPAAVTGLTLTVNNTFDAVLNWTNPTTGLNGGYYDGTITGYTILRSDGTSTDVTGSVETWTETLTADQSGYYSYSVTPINAAGNGESAVSNTEWIGDAFSGILIIDLATDNNTGAALQTEISSIYSGSVALATAIDEYPLTSDIEAIFISCGWYNNGGVKITPEEATPIVDYINAGGNVYLEGGDTFGFDPDWGGYDFNPLFGIDSAVDGSGDLEEVTGAGFLAGTNSTYTGINNYIDRLTINTAAQAIFTNQDIDPAYTCGVAYDNTYKTVAVSFQITGTENANTYINGILTFFGLGSPTGSLSGVITDSATTDPIEGATVTIGAMVRTTDASGAYSFSMLPVGDHEVVASMEFYTPQTVTVTISEDSDTPQNFALVHVPTGTLSGNVTAGGAALEGATITVDGMDATSDASGDYTITGLNPGTYDAICTKEGYIAQTISVTITGGETTDQDFVLEAVPNAAPVLSAVVDGNDVELSWTFSSGAESFADDFESGNFDNWDEAIAGPGTGGEGIPSWVVGDPDQPYEGLCARCDWGMNIDTWLISPVVSVDANTAINFDWCGSYYWSVDPEDNSDLFVKVSADDGATWTVLWTYGDIGIWENWTWYETELSLADYAGQSVKVAFNIVANDNANNFIDNVSIGASSRNEGTRKISNSVYAMNTDKSLDEIFATQTRNSRSSRNSRELTGFKVYRDGGMIHEITDATVMTYNDMDVAGGTHTYYVAAVYGDEEVNSNSVEILASDSENLEAYTTSYKGNFPNPFNPTTTVRFSIAKAADVKLVVYNVKGQIVKTLANETMAIGNHEVQWNGNDNNGKSCASGIYYIRMNVDNYSKTSKMLLMK